MNGSVLLKILKILKSSFIKIMYNKRMNEDRVFGTASARRFALRQMQRQSLRFAPGTSLLVIRALVRQAKLGVSYIVKVCIG